LSLHRGASSAKGDAPQLLMFSTPVFEGFWGVWRGVMRFLLVAVLSWLLLTSGAILMSI
jgi:hypothetical protein